MSARALAVVVLALTGCRSSLDLSGGRAYLCSRDAGSSGCREGWRCGLEGRCFDPSVGVSLVCVEPSTDCPTGWSCSAVDGRCFDPSVGSARACRDPARDCGGGWKCGLDQQCFDPLAAVTRTCADPLLHCRTGWRCGVDRLCFDPALAAAADGGARQCTEASRHCAEGQRCGLDGLCFTPARPADAGAGPECRTDQQCPVDWRCGAEEPSGRRRCQPISVAGAWFCKADSDCEARWRCDPIAQACVEPEAPLPAPPFASVTVTSLTDVDAGGPLRRFAASMEGLAQLPSFGRQPFVSVFGQLEQTGELVHTLLTWRESRYPDGGPFSIGRQLWPAPPGLLELAALPGTAFALTDAGTLFEYTFEPATRTGFDAGSRRVVAIRPSLNTPELGALVEDGQTLRFVRLEEEARNEAPPPLDVCGGAGALVDFAFAIEPGPMGPTPYFVWLTTAGVCFGSTGGPTTAVWPHQPPARPRRVLMPHHDGPGAFFRTSMQPFPVRSAVNHLVIEYSLPDGGQAFTSNPLTDWVDSTVTENGRPSIQDTMNQQLPLACDVICPDGRRALEVLALPSEPNGNRSMLARCPSVERSSLNDGGFLPESTWIVAPRGGSGGCATWRRTRSSDADEERPRRWPLTRQTSPNRRVLAGPNGQFWFPASDGGVGLRSTNLDRLPTFATRVFLNPGLGAQLFVSFSRDQYTPIPGFGLFRQGDFPDDIFPLGSVVGRPSWIIAPNLVVDARRFPAGGEAPFFVATAPSGSPWRSPAQGVEANGSLFIASDDSVSVAQVSRQIVDDFAPPATSVKALTLPGLPITAVSARVEDGGLPSVWAVTPSGVWLISSTDGRSWTPRNLPLGENDLRALCSRGTPPRVPACC